MSVDSAFAQQKTRLPKAAAFALYDLNENLVKYSDFEGKKILILSFFATWCEPCLVEIKELEEFCVKIDTTNIEILFVSIDKGKKKIVKDFVNRNQVKFRVVHDLYGLAAKSYKVKDLPTLFLIDKSGNIIFRQDGYSEKTIDRIKSKMGGAPK